jgi:hypothetical protein
MRYTLFLIFLLPLSLTGQINAYAKVTNISGNTLSLSNVDQQSDAFNVGDRLIIMQMKGASISSTSNTSGFGALSTLNSAGLYEVVYVGAINSATTSITLTGGLVNSYNVNADVQILTFPTLGANGYTVTTSLSPRAWDGNTGGVLALNINGNLFLQNNISANYKGFRGGNKAGQDGGNCEDTAWIANAGGAKYASKGEGIYKGTAAQAAGKAKSINGGGGGSVHNGGGGGGSNSTAGGAGYFGYSVTGYCSSTLSAAGQGGVAATSNKNRIFLGGGGGGGHENNSVGSNGGNGGGIILIKADTIVVESSCFPYEITANGQPAAQTGNDGAGGGGAGGSVVLDVKGIRVKNTCPLTISADGGDGGDVGNSVSHGGGGGGGQGAIFISANNTFSNVILSTNPGQGGNANNSGSPRAGDGVGPPGAGISTGVGNSLLPLGLLTISASAHDRQIEIQWRAAIQNENCSFDLMHSTDGVTWNVLGNIGAADQTGIVGSFSFFHKDPPAGDNYYRLKQSDTEDFSQIVFVFYTDLMPLLMPFPNPASGIITIAANNYEVGTQVEVVGLRGKKCVVQLIAKGNGYFTIDVSLLEEGLYFLELEDKLLKFAVVR